MEIVLHGHSTEVDDLNWRSNILNVRKRIMSIVKKGGLLDAVINDSNRNGEIDYHHLTRKYLEFESRCKKLLGNLTEAEKKHYLEGIDVEAEFATRYELLGIPKIERVRLSLFVIDNIRRWEEKKILYDEIEEVIHTEEIFEQLLHFLELTHPKLDNIEDADMRNNLNDVLNEIRISFSQSFDKAYLIQQQEIIKEVEEKLIIHMQLIDLMKRISSLNSDASDLEFLRAGVKMVSDQRAYMIEKIEKIENTFISNPIAEEYYAIGEELEHLIQVLHS